MHGGRKAQLSISGKVYTWLFDKQPCMCCHFLYFVTQNLFDNRAKTHPLHLLEDFLQVASPQFFLLLSSAFFYFRKKEQGCLCVISPVLLLAFLILMTLAAAHSQMAAVLLRLPHLTKINRIVASVRRDDND